MPPLAGEAFPSGFIFNGLVYSCVFCVGDMPTYYHQERWQRKT